MESAKSSGIGKILTVLEVGAESESPEKATTAVG